jgi:aspartate carbamoyltransferase catalytic subunit
MTSFPSLLESIDDLSKQEIIGLLSRANQFKHNPLYSPFSDINPRPLMAASFLENSTRTKHSFAIAMLRLGGLYLDFNAEASSLKKGESLEETFLTLHAQGVDLCVLRTSISHKLSEFRNNPPIKIVNGGDGTNEHPTQALLDLFTLMDIVKDLSGKTIAIIGDIIHSRVTHSLVKLLPQFGLNIILCGPKELLGDEILPEGVTICRNRNEAILQSDFIYLLRMQFERHSEEFKNQSDDYIRNFGVTLALLKELNKLIPVLHPGPANIGIEIDQALIKSSLYKGYLQVENSIPMRMAIIEAMILNNDPNIGRINGEKF